MEEAGDASSNQKQTSALIFLGTGCSVGVPNAFCLIQPSNPPCKVCFQALSHPPEVNPNYRCNTSLLVDYCQNDGQHSYTLIDVGKTFREQVLRWFTFYKIPRVDSIILTHEHADAVLGLDDISALLPLSPRSDISPLPICLTQDTMDSVAVKFPHLVQKELKGHERTRETLPLDWKIIESNCDKTFVISGLQFTPLPVMHGEDYIALGFLFGEKCRVAYVSDISRFLATTEYIISKDGGGQLELLILDTSCSNGPHNTYFCFPQTLDAVKRISPKRALLIGMTHEVDHDKDNAFLMEWSRREGIPVQLAHDGSRIPMDL
ncbi:hypothetical protein Ancab_004085 [Ancistrocladus abbreviatus]